MNTFSTSIINSDYDLITSKTLISELLSFKINHLNLKKFGEQERFGQVSEHTQNRLNELQKAKQELNNWLEQLDQDGTIHISLELKIKKI